MNYRHLLATLFVPAVLLTSACTQQPKPFDVKGVWQAQKGECGNYCRFIITDGIMDNDPKKLFIIFVNRPGKENEGYVFEHSQDAGKEDEYTFDFISGTAYLYHEGEYLVSKADITYKKEETLEEAKRKAGKK